jgi:hypothetical protein
LRATATVFPNALTLQLHSSPYTLGMTLSHVEGPG